VNALANRDVGKYFEASFVATFQKLGTFRLDGAQKQGGNVASYFCTPDGRVLHVIAGPVNAATLLREARWVVETWKLAQLAGPGDELGVKRFLQTAHAARFRERQGGKIKLERLLAIQDQPSRVHLLLTLFPMVKIEQAYSLVFEKIVGERVSTIPVVELNRKAD
jgi:hypothetical protein